MSTWLFAPSPGLALRYSAASWRAVGHSWQRKCGRMAEAERALGEFADEQQPVRIFGDVVPKRQEAAVCSKRAQSSAMVSSMANTLTGAGLSSTLTWCRSKG